MESFSKVFGWWKVKVILVLQTALISKMCKGSRGTALGFGWPSVWKLSDSRLTKSSADFSLCIWGPVQIPPIGPLCWTSSLPSLSLRGNWKSCSIDAPIKKFGFLTSPSPGWKRPGQHNQRPYRKVQATATKQMTVDKLKSAIPVHAWRAEENHETLKSGKPFLTRMWTV